MSKYKRYAVCMLIIELLIILICNVLYVQKGMGKGDRIYRVEAARVARELQNKELSSIDLEQYATILQVSEFIPKESCNNDYVVEAVGEKLYRIEYQVINNHDFWIYMNIGLGAMFVLTVILLVYVGKKVLQPFHKMSNLSYELAKGNLSVPIQEEKSKFFGRFLWGMDMLRENLESNKEKELALQKEKKTLILSLSHDIKTPLSAIKLYTRALSGNLYDTEKKRAEALQGIEKNVKEIERYVSEIVTASREDFLNLEVKVGEVYLSEIITTIQVYYRDKLSITHTGLVIENAEDCLLKGDRDRLVEVLQNIMENAIKYGDGKQIQLKFSDEEDCKLISMENGGCRLKEEELPNLFDSFYRGSNSQGIKGSGLGLYICRELMKKMDGEVFAQIKDGLFCMTVVVRKV